MLLINEKGLLTHLTLLVLGSQHTGKSELVSAFVRGSPTHGSGGRRTPAGTRTPSPAAPLGNPQVEPAPLEQAPSVYFSPYTPTIEESVTLPLVAPANEPANDPRRAMTLNLLEIGGSPALARILPSCVVAADAFMVLYDVGSRRSFQDVWQYYQLICEAKGRRMPLVVVGSMVDTLARGVRQRQVPAHARRELGEILHVPTFETSARATLAVHQIFRALIDATQRAVFDYGVSALLRRQQLLLGAIRGWEHAGQSQGRRPPTATPSAASPRPDSAASSAESGRSGSTSTHRYSTVSLTLPPHATPPADLESGPRPCSAILARRDELLGAWREYRAAHPGQEPLCGADISGQAVAPTIALAAVLPPAAEPPPVAASSPPEASLVVNLAHRGLRSTAESLDVLLRDLATFQLGQSGGLAGAEGPPEEPLAAPGGPAAARAPKSLRRSLGLWLEDRRSASAAAPTARARLGSSRARRVPARPLTVALSSGSAAGLQAPSP